MHAATVPAEVSEGIEHYVLPEGAADKVEDNLLDSHAFAEGTKAKGATMYVTLEPCAHWGKTPPCVDAVLAAGIKKIVVAMQDPNPLTRGKSLRKMKARGLEVVTGVCQADAREMNLAFIKYISTTMPYVVAKIAQTMDGQAGWRGGQVPWITAPETRAWAKQRRHEFDAIVVGVNTVLADDPRLDAPGRSIVKVIVDPHLRTPLKAKLFKGTRRGQVMMMTSGKAPRARIAAFEKQGIVVVVGPLKAGHMDLKAVFKGLAKIGLIRILIEGGPTLERAALKAGLVDRMQVYIAPKVMAGVKARDMIPGFDMELLGNSRKYKIIRAEHLGRDLLIEFDVLCV